MDRDIVIIEQWISFGRRVLRWFSLLRLGRRRLSPLSVYVLCPSARSKLSSLRFAFYTAGAGQKSPGCLSRNCHCHNITYFITIVIYRELRQHKRRRLMTCLTKDMNLKYLLFVSER